MCLFVKLKIQNVLKFKKAEQISRLNEDPKIEDAKTQPEEKSENQETWTKEKLVGLSRKFNIDLIPKVRVSPNKSFSRHRLINISVAFCQRQLCRAHDLFQHSQILRIPQCQQDSDLLERTTGTRTLF